MRKGINISHVNIENMGGRDQSRVKNKSLKMFEKVKSVPKYIPKSHNDDTVLKHAWHVIWVLGVMNTVDVFIIQ